MPPVGLKPLLFPFSTVAITVNPLYLLPKYFPFVCHILSGFFFPSPAPSLFLAFFSDTDFQVNMDLMILWIFIASGKRICSFPKLYICTKNTLNFFFFYHDLWLPQETYLFCSYGIVFFTEILVGDFTYVSFCLIFPFLYIWPIQRKAVGLHP